MENNRQLHPNGQKNASQQPQAKDNKQTTDQQEDQQFDQTTRKLLFRISVLSDCLHKRLLFPDTADDVAYVTGLPPL